MKTVIASGLSENAVKVLEKKGVGVFGFSPNNSVGESVAHHSDLSFLYCGNGKLFIAEDMERYKKDLAALGLDVTVIPEKLGKKYPDDVKLNCVLLGKYIICNIDTVSPFVLQYLMNQGKSVISVRQGYTKCSVVPVCDNALITDDESIYSACRKKGMDVLRVSKGGVRLKGFEYGFIGGACGKISETEIAFNGDINTHNDSNKIIRFLQKYNMEAVSLCESALTDIGSIIPLF